MNRENSRFRGWVIPRSVYVEGRIRMKNALTNYYWLGKNDYIQLHFLGGREIPYSLQGMRTVKCIR